MVFLLSSFPFIVCTSSVCLILNFHPKMDAETKLESRTHITKDCEVVASGYRKKLRKRVE